MHAPKKTVEDRKIYQENQESTKPKLLYPWPKYGKGRSTAGNPYNKVKAVGLYFILTTSFPWLLSLWHFLFFRRTAKLADKQVRETWILSFGLSAWSANTNEKKNVIVRGSWMKPVPTPSPFPHSSTFIFLHMVPKPFKEIKGLGPPHTSLALTQYCRGTSKVPIHVSNLNQSVEHLSAAPTSQ